MSDFYVLEIFIFFYFMQDVVGAQVHAIFSYSSFLAGHHVQIRNGTPTLVIHVWNDSTYGKDVTHRGEHVNVE